MSLPHMDVYAYARLEWSRQCMAAAVAAMQHAERAARDRHHCEAFALDPRDWFHRERKILRGREALADALQKAEACGNVDDSVPRDQADSMAFMVSLAATAVWAFAADSSRGACTAEAFWVGLRRETRWQEATWELWSRTLVGVDEAMEVHQ